MFDQVQPFESIKKSFQKPQTLNTREELYRGKRVLEFFNRLIPLMEQWHPEKYKLLHADKYLSSQCVNNMHLKIVGKGTQSKIVGGN